MNKKVKTAIIVGVILLVGGGGAACVAGMASNIAAVENMASGHETAKAEIQDVSNYVSASGTVEGGNSVKIAPPANSKVLELNTELGSGVTKDELLCVFDSEDLQNEYDNLKKKYKLSEDQTDSEHERNERALKIAKEDRDIAVGEAEDTLKKAKDERDKAYKDFNDEVKKYNDKVVKRNKAYDDMRNADYSRQEELYEKYVTLNTEVEAEKPQLDAKKEGLTAYDEAVNAAQRTYDAAVRQGDQAVQAAQDVIDSEKFTADDTVKQQIKDLKKQIDDCQVKAPIDGVVTALAITEGGLPEGSSILTIEDTEHLKITVSIKEKDIMSLKEGMKAEITATAMPDMTFSGTVSRVVLVPAVSVGEGGTTSSYTADVTIDDKDCGLLLGMNAKVRIILEEKKNTLSVPFDAIVTADDGSKQVFVADDLTENSCTARAVKVDVELETDYYVAVSSSELKDGDTLILDPDGIKDGESVVLSDMTYDLGGEDSQ